MYRIFLVPIFLLTTLHSFGQDYRQLKNLSGGWKFSVGDDPRRAAPDYDDSDWDIIRVPDYWENQGYDDYDGYAWYRKTFAVEKYSHYPVFLLLGYIDDVDEIYLNGKLLARTGSFPPDFVTKYNYQRIFRIPDEELKKQAITIAVRVFDHLGGGGIYRGRVGLYYDLDAALIDIPLSGKWKFKPGRDKDWTKKSYPDQDWDEINVPGSWDSQGYSDYDGYACYRKTFTIPGGTDLKDLYLVLGKIDDYDYVYVNGESIGSYRTLQRSFNFPGDANTWRNLRLYPIPDGLLRTGENQIAVRVLDIRAQGGIYAGPVGITSKENYWRLSRKYHRERNFWEFLIESIFD